MLRGFWSQTDLFYFNLGLSLARLAILLRLLVQELSIIKHPAHRRLGIRGDFDQVESSVLSELERILDWDNPNILAVGANQAYFTCSNVCVYSVIRCADLLLLLLH